MQDEQRTDIQDEEQTDIQDEQGTEERKIIPPENKAIRFVILGIP